jgi:hypothetical protein
VTAVTTAAAPARQRLPFIVPLLALGTFLMITTEYIVAGLLQEISDGISKWEPPAIRHLRSSLLSGQGIVTHPGAQYRQATHIL